MTVRGGRPSQGLRFGLLVFLIGQALILGAFIVGHYPAWSIGLLCSIGGIAVSILSVNEALRRLEEKLNDYEPRRGSLRENSRSD